MRLERDVVGRDDYGRLLAYVYIAADGRFVNLALVEQGFATPLSIVPNTTYARPLRRRRHAPPRRPALGRLCGG